MNRLSAIAACFTALGVVAASPQPAVAATRDHAAKDQSRIIPDLDAIGPGAGYHDSGRGRHMDQTTPPDSVPMPAGQTVELTTDAAKRALDAFAEVRESHADEEMQDYDSLEAFVRETEAGKRLEADIQAHGFSDVGEWSAIIMAIGFAYDAVLEGHESDVEQQIETLRDDHTLDESLRRDLIASLSALIPSENNKQVLRDLLEDPIYRDKLKAFEAQE